MSGKTGFVKREPLIDAETLRGLFLRAWDESRDLDACFDVLEAAVDRRHYLKPTVEKPRDCLALDIPDVRLVIEGVAAIADLKPEEITLRSKRPVIVQWRRAVIWLLTQDGRSQSWAGRVFGGDHTMGIRAVAATEALLARTPGLRARLLAVLPSEERRAA